MNKLLVTIAVVALASVSLAGGAVAKPGKPGSQQIAQQTPGFIPNIKLGGFNLKTVGGETTSPGDAFYPDAAVGDPHQDCLDLGGTLVRHFADDGFYWTCRI